MSEAHSDAHVDAAERARERRQHTYPSPTRYEGECCAWCRLPVDERGECDSAECCDAHECSNVLCSRPLWTPEELADGWCERCGCTVCGKAPSTTRDQNGNDVCAACARRAARAALRAAGWRYAGYGWWRRTAGGPTCTEREALRRAGVSP